MQWQQQPNGQLIYLRRTTDKGLVSFLGLSWEIDPLWQHRLVRSEVDLQADQISFYRLRRREPSDQPLIKTISYQLPQRKFDMRPRHRHPVTPHPLTHPVREGHLAHQSRLCSDRFIRVTARRSLIPRADITQL